MYAILINENILEVYWANIASMNCATRDSKYREDSRLRKLLFKNNLLLLFSIELKKITH